MEVPAAVSIWCAENGWGQVVSAQTLVGGMISQAARLEMGNGRSLILKANPDAPDDLFVREAEGLAALQIPGWQDRVDIYNLYHLLNHLNIFGASYLGRVQAILNCYD